MVRAQSHDRTGILGGTFNPLHIGHLILAQSALEALDLATVLFVPCARPPHKTPLMLAEARHRLAMVEAALAGDIRFEACDVEIKRGGVSYAVDTVAQLHDANPSAELCFIIGSDTLKELHLWKDIYTLLSLCRFVTFGRPGFNIGSIGPGDLQLDPPWPDRLLRNVVSSRMVEVSSSDIRHRVAEGMSIRYLVPDAVEMYVAEHGLYCNA